MCQAFLRLLLKIQSEDVTINIRKRGMTTVKGYIMSLTAEFVKGIERKILTGEWAVGDRLPTLRSLAQNSYVSRSVINAGIVELQSKGYIQTVPRKYSAVADWKKRGTFAVLRGIVENELYDENFVNNILDARMTIECAAVRDAAVKRTAEDIRELRKIIDEENKVVDPNETIAADIAFHHTVAVASQNIVYPMLLNSFEDMIIKFVAVFYRNSSDRKSLYLNHDLICYAIADKDPDLAENTMKTILKQGEAVVKKYISLKEENYAEI